MATLSVPQDLIERLRARPRGLADDRPLTADEKEMLALRLEWLAAMVREEPVLETSWEQDREIHRDDFAMVTTAHHYPGPWRHTVEIQFGFSQ